MKQARTAPYETHAAAFIALVGLLTIGGFFFFQYVYYRSTCYGDFFINRLFYLLIISGIFCLIYHQFVWFFFQTNWEN